MIHFQTRNKSALKLYFLLKEMGIKNNAFFLELKNPELAEVNPFDNNLDNITKAKILVEVRQNIWYYLREVVRIPDNGLLDYEFHRGNVAMTWLLLRNFNIFTILPRQRFKTFTMCAFYSWILYFGGFRSNVIHFSYCDDVLKNNIQRIKSIRDILPPYLNLYNKKDDKDNQKEIVFDELGNSFRIKAPAKSKDEATKIGRGFSTPMQWYDEFPFIPNLKEQYESALFAFSTSSNNAKKNGLPYHIAITTTPGFLNQEEGIYAYNFLKASCDFNEHIYDKEPHEIEKILKNNSKTNFFRVEYMYYDLSVDEDYFEKQSKLCGSKDSIDRDILLVWKDVSKEHPLGQDLTEALTMYKKDPTSVIVINDIYFLKLYVDQDSINWEDTYVGALDTSGNLSRDFTALVIINPLNFEVVATLRSNLYSTTNFVKALKIVMKKYFKNMILVPERNNMGITVIDMLLEDYSLKNRVYHDEKNIPGVATTEKIRNLLFNEILRTAVIEDQQKIHDRSIIEEILSLTINRNGRIDHLPGKHDDTLFAYLLGRWFLLYAPNKSKYVFVETVGIYRDKSIEDITVEDVEVMSEVKKNRNDWSTAIISSGKRNKFDELFGFINEKDIINNVCGENEDNDANSLISKILNIKTDDEDVVNSEEIVVKKSKEELDEEKMYGMKEDEIRSVVKNVASKNFDSREEKSKEEEIDYKRLFYKLFRK